jgi:hypothetical protein
MIPILDTPISKHRHNMKCWLIDVAGWDFTKRITYREMAHQIFNDKDMRIVKIDVPIDENRPFIGVKTVYRVRYDRKPVRDVPPEVGEYYFNLVIDAELLK